MQLRRSSLSAAAVVIAGAVLCSLSGPERAPAALGSADASAAAAPRTQSRMISSLLGWLTPASAEQSFCSTSFPQVSVCH
jgi:hypothetical protein